MLEKGHKAHRYRKTQKEYADAYGVSLVTVKRWVKRGLPLDDPRAMEEYRSLRGRKKHTDAGEVCGADSCAAVSEKDVPIELDETFFEGRGVLAAIERLQKAERERAAAYFAELRQKPEPRPQFLHNRFSEWIGIVEALRKLEKDAPDIRRLNELIIDKSEAEGAIAAVFQAFRGAANTLPPRAASKIVGLREHQEILDVLEGEVEVLLRALTEITLGAVQVDGYDDPKE